LSYPSVDVCPWQFRPELFQTYAAGAFDLKKCREHTAFAGTYWSDLINFRLKGATGLAPLPFLGHANAALIVRGKVHFPAFPYLCGVSSGVTILAL
jgi:hypothetical protein